MCDKKKSIIPFKVYNELAEEYGYNVLEIKDGYKVCSICGFLFKQRWKYDAYCKPCTNEYKRDYRKRKKRGETPPIREMICRICGKKISQLHRREYLCKECYRKKAKKSSKIYRDKNREFVRKSARKSAIKARLKNPERIRENSRRHYHNHIEKYREKNRKESRIYYHKKREKLKKIRDKIDKIEMEIYKKFGDSFCYICEKSFGGESFEEFKNGRGRMIYVDGSTKWIPVCSSCSKK